jgi:phosphoribosylpyrophosphate synthetase
MLIFVLNATQALGKGFGRALGVELAPHEERDFEDGEHKARPLTSVRGRDVYVVQSLHGGPDASPNDKLCRFLFLAGALRDPLTLVAGLLRTPFLPFVVLVLIGKAGRYAAVLLIVG